MRCPDPGRDCEEAEVSTISGTLKQEYLFIDLVEGLPKDF
jgi:hypothetical protein